MTKEIISTDKAPAAIGPYNQAVVSGFTVYCSGQIPLDPVSMTLVEGDIEVQTRQVLTNLSKLLTATGSSLENAIKTTVYLKNMDDFSRMNAVYAEFFTENQPARSTVAVKTLPMDVDVEIDCIAVI